MSLHTIPFCMSNLPFGITLLLFEIYILFRIHGSRDLLVVSSLNFENVCFLFVLERYLCLVWKFMLQWFSVSLFFCTLVSILCDVKSAITLITFLLRVICSYFLECFKYILLLSLCSVTIMCLKLNLFLFILFKLYWSPASGVLSILLKSSQPFYLQILSIPKSSSFLNL